MTAPVVLSDRPERAQLSAVGGVVVFRSTTRPTGLWEWRPSESGQSRGDVLVSEIGQVEPDDDTVLRSYRNLSGFTTLGEWRTAIRERNDGLPESGWLYYVAYPADPARTEG